MAHVAWTLTDSSGVTPEVLILEINPNEFEPPNRQATITEDRTVAGNGRPILFQGPDAVRKGSINGLVRSEAFRSEIEDWASRWWPIVMTDDLANSWTVIFTQLSWKRLRRATNPHRYDYTIEFLVIE